MGQEAEDFQAASFSEWEVDSMSEDRLWHKAAQQAQTEMPFGQLEEIEERAEQIFKQMTESVEVVDPFPKSPQVQHESGKTVADHREAGRRLMIAAGVDPDAPLNVDWERTPDIRDNRDPQTVGAAYLAERQLLKGLTTPMTATNGKPKTDFKI